MCIGRFQVGFKPIKRGFGRELASGFQSGEGVSEYPLEFQEDS